MPKFKMNSLDEAIRNERDVKLLLDIARDATDKMRSGEPRNRLVIRLAAILTRRAAEDRGDQQV
jgi:hypothetical protein